MVFAAVLGAGVSLEREYRAWSAVNCSDDDLDNGTSTIVGSPCNGTLAFVIIVSVNGGLTLYAGDSVGSYADAQARLASLPAPLVNASCRQRVASRDTALLYPAVCPSCSLSCGDTAAVPLLLNSSSLQSQHDTATTLTAVGASLSAAFIVTLLVFVTLFQLRHDTFSRAAALDGTAAEEEATML